MNLPFIFMLVTCFVRITTLQCVLWLAQKFDALITTDRLYALTATCNQAGQGTLLYHWEGSTTQLETRQLRLRLQ